MADFNALTALINAYIKQNGVKAITGQILNGVLRGMVSALGKGYTVAGEASPTTDPGTMTGPVAYIAHTAGTYEHFGNLVAAQGEVAMLIYDEAVWRKDVLLSLSANATVDANVGTPEVTCTFVDGVLTFDFRNMKGNPGDAAGFGAVTATVDANVGTPGVSVQTSGPDTAKNITFAFRNLKGETGVTSCVVTVDNTTGTPSCAVSLVGQELHLDFSGLKGAQGNTGSSVDYPFEIVNNLTTNDATKALSAAMGVQLESEVSQLEAELYGEQSNDRLVEINVAGGVTISGGTRYPTDVDIPADTYNIVWDGGVVLADTTWYFYDGDGNQITTIKNKNGTVVSAIQATSTATQSPYIFPTAVAQIKLYGGTPSANGTISFKFESQSPASPGLKERFEDLEDSVGDLSNLDTNNKDTIVDAINEVLADVGSSSNVRIVPIMSVKQIEQMEIASGFWWNGANASDSFFYVHVTGLKDGDLIFLRNSNGVTCRCRFLQGYKGNATVSGQDDNTSTLSVYRVAGGVDNAYMSFYNTVRTSETYAYVVSFEEQQAEAELAPCEVVKDSVAANAKVTLPNALENKKNVSIDYYAKFSSFSSVRVGQGNGIANGAYAVIDATKVYIYIGTSANPVWSADHGLSISDFIQVHIQVNGIHQAKITITSKAGQYSGVYYTWAACAGDIFAIAGMATTEVKLTYFCGGWKYDTMLVGDSYISYASDRYPYYLQTVYNAYEKILSCGISGGEVGYTIPAVVENFIKHPPKVLVWAMGMNDPDTQSAVNKSWNNTYLFIKDLCEFSGTELVLATIPCVPSYSNYFKNDVVKASGFRYIDFAKAVGGEEVGSSWYAGMLYTDNVHPTALGAKALASRFVQDFPDTIQE